MYKKNLSAHSIGERMVFKSWTILTTLITKTNLITQTIWTTATIQTTAQIPVTAQIAQTTTLEKTQAPTLLKTADSFVEPLPESTRPRKDGPGGD